MYSTSEVKEFERIFNEVADPTDRSLPIKPFIVRYDELEKAKNAISFWTGGVEVTRNADGTYTIQSKGKQYYY